MLEEYPNITIYGGNDSEGVNYFLKDQEIFKIGEITVKSLHTPCHTRDSICYFIEDEGENVVFTGDTLFNGGCGKFTEGNAEEMHRNLNKILASLPDDTKIYFTRTIFNSDKLSKVSEFANNNKITCGKFTISDEKTYNPFMMSIEIQKATKELDPIKVMAKLREMKNKF
ncbi:hypothetical protein PCANB_001980 [Pneumocystis canis]|nr:hypothetical protein PCANB_001980 [Pneumocystis canis]